MSGPRGLGAQGPLMHELTELINLMSLISVYFSIFECVSVHIDSSSKLWLLAIFPCGKIMGATWDLAPSPT